jgi:ribonucleoside-diphosphate reductase alpha chain
MCCISVHSCEIDTFINIKRDKTKVTGANLSIKLSDTFMNAVKNDTDYVQQWPINSPNPVLSKIVRARDVWEQIIDAAWSSAEPGLLFWDTITGKTPSDCYASEGFTTEGVNPCAEQGLNPFGSCILMSDNLLSFVKKPFTKDAYFDYVEYDKTVYVSQRLIDDLVDLELEKVDNIISKIENDPEDILVKREELELWTNVRDICIKGRRTGHGITGLGDTIAALGIRYGSDASIDVTEKIYKTLAVSSYKASIDMAEERGSFPIFNYDNEKSHEYISKIVGELGPEYILKWKKFGRRNICLTTTAPTGTVSMMTQTTSGIEPCFQPVYKRRKKIQNKDERVDFTDVKGDKWQEFEVCHHQFSKWREITGLTNVEDSPYWKATANDFKNL